MDDNDRVRTYQRIAYAGRFDVLWFAIAHKGWIACAHEQWFANAHEKEYE